MASISLDINWDLKDLEFLDAIRALLGNKLEGERGRSRSLQSHT